MPFRFLLFACLLGCTPERPDTVDKNLASAHAYTNAVDALQAQVEGARRSVESQESWLRLASLAGRQLELAKLTGDYAMYAAALATCEHAFEVTREGSGPFVACAAVDLSMHRLAEAKRKLDYVLSLHYVSGTEERVAQHLMRADVAMQEGDYAKARESLASAREFGESYGLLLRQAQYLWQTGEPSEADELFVRALGARTLPARDRAWLELQRGLLSMDGGRYDEALTRFRAADALFGGWWLVEEHLAEALARAGDENQARVIFRRLVERPDHHPEHLDALSALAEPRERARLRREAGDEHRGRMEIAESAAMGHALDHFLMYGTAAEALELARTNHETRPGGEAKVKLAQALVRAEQMDEAHRVITEALETGYSTPAVHATAYWIYQRSNDPRAEAEAEKARSLAVDAVERLAWMR